MTSPFKMMELVDLDLGQLKESETALQERRKQLKPAVSNRPGAGAGTGAGAGAGVGAGVGVGAGIESDLQSVRSFDTISQQTMESSPAYDTPARRNGLSDGEVAVPVEWLDAKKRQLRPTSGTLRGTSAAGGLIRIEPLDDEDAASVGSVGTSELSQSTYATRSTHAHTALTTHTTHTATSATSAARTNASASSFLALLKPLRPIAHAPRTPAATPVPTDWKLDRLKTTDEIPHPIPTRHASIRPRRKTIITTPGATTPGSGTRVAFSPSASTVDYSKALSPTELIQMLQTIKTAPVYPRRVDAPATPTGSSGSGSGGSVGGSYSGSGKSVGGSGKW
jgi:hypothetical protein